MSSNLQDTGSSIIDPDEITSAQNRAINTAQNLPSEVLMDIFEAVILPPRQTRIHLSCHRNAESHVWRSLPYVCSHWHGPAISVLYASVEIRTYNELLGLLRCLQTYPHIRPLIRGLHLPMRATVTLPTVVHRICCQIIHLVENLQKLSTAGISIKRFSKYGTWEGPHLTLPISPSRHKELDYLELRGEHALLSVELPPQILSFTRLRNLTLADVKLTVRVDPTKTPVLQSLEVISFTNHVTYDLLDDWLCAHPRLHTLCLYEASRPKSLPRLLFSGRIKTMEMMHCMDIDPLWNRIIGTWFNACSSVRNLRITDDILVRFHKIIPTKLYVLHIEIARRWVPLHHWQSYLSRSPQIHLILLSAHLSRKWYKELGTRFLLTAAQQGHTIEFEPPHCDCEQEKNSRHYTRDERNADEQEVFIAGWDRASESQTRR